MIISAAFCSIAKDTYTKTLMIIFVFNNYNKTFFCPFDVKQFPKIMIFYGPIYVDLF